jgi:multimeric flavodoxin WrbA
MPKKILVVAASPRPDGNSRLLATALQEGGREAGHQVDVVDLNLVMSGLLRDCRRCRRPDGSCAIDDNFGAFLHDSVLPADGLVYATPLYWYGMAAAMKNFSTAWCVTSRGATRVTRRWRPPWSISARRS